MTSWLHSVFNWMLLPLFENSLSGFRYFTHLVFENLFYKWIICLLENIVYYFMVLLKPILNWVPFIPDITVPIWFRDTALVSLILLRSQNRAMKESDPLSTLEMTKEELAEWDNSVNTTPWIVSTSIAILWRVVLTLYFLTKIIKFPFRILRFQKIEEFIALFVGGSLMLGLAYFLHDVVLSYATRTVNSQKSVAHRAFMKLMGMILFSALAASLIFFATNGYLIHTHEK